MTTAELPAGRAPRGAWLRALGRRAQTVAIAAVLATRVYAKEHNVAVRVQASVPGVAGAACAVIAFGLWFGWPAAFATAAVFLLRIDSRR